MKEKEEDEERNENICPQTDREQTIKQSMNSKTEATLILCGSSGERANILIKHIKLINVGVLIHSLFHSGFPSQSEKNILLSYLKRPLVILDYYCLCVYHCGGLF